MYCWMMQKMMKTGGQFFTPGGGFRQGATHGFDMTELGQIMSMGAARGAFKGMDLGNLMIQGD